MARRRGGLVHRQDSMRLRAAILSLQPTRYWPLDDGSSPLRSAGQFSAATVVGSPLYGAAAPGPIGRGVTWSGSGQYATSATVPPTPTTSVSAFALFRTTSSAVARIISRGSGGQYSWSLLLNNATLVPQFQLWQSTAATHVIVTCGSGAAVDDGRWTLAVGTFDSVTALGYRMTAEAGLTTGTPGTVLSGTWKKDSTSPIRIAHVDGVGLFTGTMAHIAFWNDRILSAADVGWLGSIAFGG